MKILAKNKRAYHDFDIQDKIEAGIILKGHEVKSIKSGQINIKDAIIRLQNNEVFILNMDVPFYKKASLQQTGPYDPKEKRKLLLNKREITKLFTKTNKTGLSLIPLQVYYTSKHRIKILIGLGKRMKKIMKKQILKERDTKRQMEKSIKSMGL